jgi:hypothetical protein
MKRRLTPNSAVCKVPPKNSRDLKRRLGLRSVGNVQSLSSTRKVAQAKMNPDSGTDGERSRHLVTRLGQEGCLLGDAPGESMSRSLATLLKKVSPPTLVYHTQDK